MHTERGLLPGLLDSRSERVPVVSLTYQDACRCLELTDNDPKYHLFAFGTGYLNVLGQAANLGCSAYLTADCIDFMVQQMNGHQFSPLETLLTYASESVQSPVHRWPHPHLLRAVHHMCVPASPPCVTSCVLGLFYRHGHRLHSCG